MNKKTISYMVALVCLMIVVVGCSSGTPPAPQNPAQDDTPVPEPTNAAPANTPATTSTENTQTSNGLSDFKKFIGMKSTASWQVTYQMTSNTAGQAFSAEMKQYVKGTKIRQDITTQGIEVWTFILSDGIYSCNKATGDWSCLKIDANIPETERVQKELEANPDKFNVVFIGTKTVAGTTTQCYKASNLEGYAVEYCFSKEAVPLYIKTEGQNVLMEITATSYSTSVPADAFTVPAEAKPIQIPTMPQVPLGDAGGNSDPCAICNSLPGSAKDACLQSC